MKGNSKNTTLQKNGHGKLKVMCCSRSVDYQSDSLQSVTKLLDIYNEFSTPCTAYTVFDNKAFNPMDTFVSGTFFPYRTLCFNSALVEASTKPIFFICLGSSIYNLPMNFVRSRDIRFCPQTVMNRTSVMVLNHF